MFDVKTQLEQVFDFVSSTGYVAGTQVDAQEGPWRRNRD